MPVRRRTPPKQSIFSLSPITGEPFATVAYAENLIMKNIHMNHTPSIELYGMDELTQDALTRLSLVEYKPDLSAPRTFIINASNQAVWNKWRYMQNAGRNLVVPEFSISGPDDEFMSILDIMQEATTPEDILLAKELATDFYMKEAEKPLEKQSEWAKPIDYRGFKPPWDDKKRASILEACKRLKKTK